jgi:hypothetical protein
MAKFPKFPKFRNIFGFPRAPKFSPGHRGTHATSLHMRQAKINRGESPYSQEEMRQWRAIPSDEVEDFICNEQPIFFHSSNVNMAQFFRGEKKLMVEYKGKNDKPNSAYLYEDISEDEALSLVNSGSKGGWVWDSLRIRGTVYGTKKVYHRIR